MNELLIALGIIGGVLYIIFATTQASMLYDCDNCVTNEALEYIFNNTKCYSTFFGFISPLVLITRFIVFIYRNSIGKAKKELKQKAFQSKLFINANSIYDFVAGDIILLKNTKKVTLNEFSLNGFTDFGNNVYSWLDAHENITYNERAIKNNNDIKLAFFKKEAVDFKQKVNEYQKEMQKQKEEMLKNLGE